ncbi:MAG TPA: MFS transporter [Nocardioides sp.]|uniref:MFS transporter n=1 Tax=uncultured Nocardioides sp. TaxID=198441 RepID=UPI000EC24573|nr:MFS transporter [uncultured Nocardioides sp.]HCB04623.1 MFS transporter [Nocardioides sp.]HRI96722.1 MFS transporter [Nocardioides sp.]HRK47074.1 MFS transporter [Nocardioides sp.]
MTTRASATATLREPNFRYYFISRLVNGAGSAMAGIALAFAVLEVSDSASALGIVLAAHSIPEVAFLLAGGVIADRFGRKLVIQVCNVLAGLTQLGIAALVIGGTTELWHIAALSAINGTVAAVSFPALASLMPQLVPREQLQPANALMSIQRGLLSVVGPTVGGILVVTVGAGWALAIDGVTYILAAATLLLVRIPPTPPKGERTSMVHDLREGWRYFTGTTWLWVVVLAFGFLNMLHSGAIFTLGPVLAKQTSIGETGWGLGLSAQAAGLLLLSLVMIRVRLERPLLWGMLGCALFGLPMLVLGLDPHVGALVAAFFVAGIGMELFGLGWNLAMQEHVPDEMLSRAYSYDALGSFVAIPIGQLVAGPLALVFGIRETILASGILYMVVCLATLGSRAVRDLQRAETVPGGSEVRAP